MQVALDESNERTRKWIFQQKMGQAETKELSYSSLMCIGGGGGDATRQSQELEIVRQKLKNVFSTLKHLANKAACRLDVFIFNSNTITKDLYIMYFTI